MINMPGGPELLVIFLVALIVLGPQQLPKAMRTFGSVMAEVRKVSNNFQAEMRSAMDSVVDTSGNEKPQSGSMAKATPASATTDAAGEPVTVGEPTLDEFDEIVARNLAEEHADQGDGAQVDEPPSADEPPSDPAAGDPADRAAG